MNRAKTIVVIGGAGAIGMGICTWCAQQGHRVIVADKSESVTDIANGLPGGSDHCGVIVNVLDADAIADFFERGEGNAADGLVYAAGANWTGHVRDMPWPDYQRVQDVNLRGAFAVAKGCAQSLAQAPRSFAAVFLSSTAGLTGESGGSVYCASKFGLLGFVQSWASEIAQYGGRANAVCPGNVDSPMLRTLAKQIAEREGLVGEDVLQSMADSCAFHRLITIREVANAVGFLLSDKVSGISGQQLVVNGAVL